MSEADLNRVRGDIESIREVAGLELPFGREDVLFNLALVPYGAYLALLGTFAPWSYIRPLVLIPTLGFVLAALVLRIRFRRSTGRSPARRREYTLGLVAGPLYGLLAGGYLMWARSVGEPIAISGGLAVAMAGGLCAVLAMTGRGRQYWFAAASSLLAYGLIVPSCSPRGVVIAGGAASALTGLLGAPIMAWQLRSQGGVHERVAH